MSEEKNSGENSNLRRGNPGNTGGKKGRSGRTPGVIRQACAKAFDQRIKFLKAVVDGETGPYLKHKDGQIMLDDQGRPQREGADIAERLKAMDLLGKYGGLQKVEHEHDDKREHRDRLTRLRELIGELN